MGTRGSFPGGKVAGGEADRSPPSSAEVKECVKLYLHSLNTPPWRGAQLKHRDNFTFSFIYILDLKYVIYGHTGSQPATRWVTAKVKRLKRRRKQRKKKVDKKGNEESCWWW
jgi:hypothetical protein